MINYMLYLVTFGVLHWLLTNAQLSNLIFISLNGRTYVWAKKKSKNFKKLPQTSELDISVNKKKNKELHLWLYVPQLAG